MSTFPPTLLTEEEYYTRENSCAIVPLKHSLPSVHIYNIVTIKNLYIFLFGKTA